MSLRRLVASPTISISTASARGPRRSHLRDHTIIIHVHGYGYGYGYGNGDNRRRGFCWVRRPKPLTCARHVDSTTMSLTHGHDSADTPATSGVVDPSKVANDSIAAHSDASNKNYKKRDSSRRTLNVNHASIRIHGSEEQEETRWFPYVDQFKVKDKVLTSTRILEMLGPFMLEERRNRIERVVLNRTYSVCPVVEGLLDLGNIAAVFRSADALGFQSVQVIANEAEKRYKQNRNISMGSEKWLDAELFDSTKDCIEELRSRGYRIAVASIGHHSVPISEMDWTIPTAVVFGNELRGVSEDAVRFSDIQCYIPMEGMVDSFNVSVAAGIVMHHAVNDRKARLGKHGDLSAEEHNILSADFYLRHSSRSLSVLTTLLQKKQEAMQKSSLSSVLQGDLENDIDLPDYLKIDLEKVNL